MKSYLPKYILASKNYTYIQNIFCKIFKTIHTTCDHHFLATRILFLGDKLGSNSGIRSLHIPKGKKNCNYCD
jgi:hypothetical protein